MDVQTCIVILYNGVERELSHVLQPPNNLNHEEADQIRTARDNVRLVMRKLGYKGYF